MSDLEDAEDLLETLTWAFELEPNGLSAWAQVTLEREKALREARAWLTARQAARAQERVSNG